MWITLMYGLSTYTFAILQPNQMPLPIIAKTRYFLILHEYFHILSLRLLGTLVCILDIVINVLHVLVSIAMVELAVVVHVRLLVGSHNGVGLAPSIFRRRVIAIYQLVHLVHTLKLAPQK